MDIRVPFAKTMSSESGSDLTHSVERSPSAKNVVRTVLSCSETMEHCQLPLNPFFIEVEDTCFSVDEAALTGKSDKNRAQFSSTATRRLPLIQCRS
jgi:hypothetical protein